jgi:hypothetical protein
VSQFFTARTLTINTVVLRVAPASRPSTIRIGIYTDPSLQHPVQVLQGVPTEATWAAETRFN